jgi:hypothetical protein
LQLQEVGLDGAEEPVGAVLDFQALLAQAAELGLEGLGVGCGVELLGQLLPFDPLRMGQQQG